MMREMSVMARGHQTTSPEPATQRVLVVDDEASIVEVLCMLLEDEGFVVIGETDPARAVRAIRREHPDLLLTDVMMPGMSGYELASVATSIDPEIQVVYMSAVVEPRETSSGPFLANRSISGR